MGGTPPSSGCVEIYKGKVVAYTFQLNGYTFDYLPSLNEMLVLKSNAVLGCGTICTSGYQIFHDGRRLSRDTQNLFYGFQRAKLVIDGTEKIKKKLRNCVIVLMITILIIAK